MAAAVERPRRTLKGWAIGIECYCRRKSHWRRQRVIAGLNAPASRGLAEKLP